MQKIQGESIREVSSLAYVSTATFLRFVQKIGFSGYSKFTTVIKFTLINQQQNAKEKLPFTVKQNDYREEYLKNIIEAVRVIKPAKLARVTAKLAEHPEVFSSQMVFLSTWPSICITCTQWRAFRSISHEIRITVA